MRLIVAFALVLSALTREAWSEEHPIPFRRPTPRTAMICWGTLPEATVCGSPQTETDTLTVYRAMLTNNPELKWEDVGHTMAAHIVFSFEPDFAEYACHVIPEGDPECNEGEDRR